MRYAWIEEHCDGLSITRMCHQLAVSRTGYNGEPALRASGLWPTRF